MLHRQRVQLLVNCSVKKMLFGKIYNQINGNEQFASLKQLQCGRCTEKKTFSSPSLLFLCLCLFNDVDHLCCCFRHFHFVVALRAANKNCVLTQFMNVFPCRQSKNKQQSFLSFSETYVLLLLLLFFGNIPNSQPCNLLNHYVFQYSLYYFVFLVLFAKKTCTDEFIWILAAIRKRIWKTLIFVYDGPL